MSLLKWRQELRDSMFVKSGKFRETWLTRDIEALYQLSMLYYYTSLIIIVAQVEPQVTTLVLNIYLQRTKIIYLK